MTLWAQGPSIYYIKCVVQNANTFGSSQNSRWLDASAGVPEKSHTGNIVIWFRVQGLVEGPDDTSTDRNTIQSHIY